MRRVPALPAAEAQQQQPQADRLCLHDDAQTRAHQRPAPDAHDAEVAALPPLQRPHSPVLRPSADASL